MSDYSENVAKYTTANESAIDGIVKHLGIALRNRDSSLVSCTDPAELNRIRDGFMKKKLALTDSDAELEKTLSEICEQMKAERNKSRVTFYYLVAEKYGKLDMFVK